MILLDDPPHDPRARRQRIERRLRNVPAAYYPGDDVVDWVGISAYGSERRGTSDMLVQDDPAVGGAFHAALSAPAVVDAPIIY